MDNLIDIVPRIGYIILIGPVSLILVGYHLRIVYYRSLTSNRASTEKAFGIQIRHYVRRTIEDASSTGVGFRVSPMPVTSKTKGLNN